MDWVKMILIEALFPPVERQRGRGRWLWASKYSLFIGV